MTEYVKFSVSSVNAQWTSHVVRALIAPGLCTSVILGLPWLEKNDIVVDFTAHTCIDKKSNYDLLNLPQQQLIIAKEPKKQIRDIAMQLKKDCEAMLKELKFIPALRLKSIEFEEVTPVDIVAAINTRIEQLSGLTGLMH